MKRSLKNILMIAFIIIMSTLMVFTVMNANSSNNNEMPSMGEKPAEMPTENTNMGNTPNSEDSTEKDKDSSNMAEPPEKPDGDNNGPMGDSNFNSQNNNSLSWTYYVILGIESLLISTTLMYLVMSGFNKKTIKETFINKDKILINVLAIIILTSGITYISTKFISDGNNQIESKGQMDSNNQVEYSATKEIKESVDIEDETYDSSTKDENTLLIDGDIDVNLSNVNVTKSGDSNSGDSTSFYGNNSAILAKSGANLVLKNINVVTNADGANGVFSYGGSATTNNENSDGTKVTISDSKIVTKKDNSGGIMTTGGGIMNAYNLDIETMGTSSAAIRTDRGGGVVTVDGGTYKTSGQGSPTVYSTADVTVSNATLTATASEGIVIEGKNSVTLNKCTLTDTNNKLNGQSTTYKNIFLYQSMSGDAASGNSVFTASNSSITTNKGDTFYVTNTSSTINLTNNTIVNNDKTGNFLRVQADSWGTNGSNGGDVTLNLIKQEAVGNIVIDKISTLNMIMKDSSYFEGAINNDNSAKEIKLTLDKSSTIKLTGDSYVTELDNADTSNSNIDFNGYKLYVNGKAIN